MQTGELRPLTGSYWLFGRNAVDCTARTGPSVQGLAGFLTPPVPAGRAQPHVLANALLPPALLGLGSIPFCESKSLRTQHKDQ